MAVTASWLKRAIDANYNKTTAAPHLLAGRDLTGTLTTVDAMHTQEDLAE
jgi:predicted transposase YbfD/YdcC